jgi:hypothetical protein
MTKTNRANEYSPSPPARAGDPIDVQMKLSWILYKQNEEKEGRRMLGFDQLQIPILQLLSN